MSDAEVLKMLRIAYHNYERKDVANIIGVTTAYLNEVERGKKRISIGIIQRLAGLYNVTSLGLTRLFRELGSYDISKSDDYQKALMKILTFFSENKLGDYIASPIVSAVDDSTIPGEWGSIDIDDEGNPGTKRLLIKNGKLVNYMIDDYNGRRMNREGNGACRRQNYRYCPTSRMSNTYICNGKSTPEEIIAATKLGLYAVSFNGGSVDPTTGEFNFGCSEAYIIRDGKVCEPVKGATLIGHGDEILKHIDMVGNDLALAQGMCGAASGSIRTNVGQPTLRVSEVTVGGRGGELK